MKKEELAAKLNGREYAYEITKEEEAEAKASGLVAAFGASDDLLEFRGAIDDEFNAYKGTEVPITHNGLPPSNECDDDRCPYYLRLLASIENKVTATWDKEGYSWVISATVPFAPFDIIEDGDKYCRGVVFELPVGSVTR